MAAQLSAFQIQGTLKRYHGLHGNALDPAFLAQAGRGEEIALLKKVCAVLAHCETKKISPENVTKAIFWRSGDGVELEVELAG